MSRVTGSIITVERKSGPVLYIKARDRTGRQIKKRLGPEADWSKRKRETALREFLVDLGRTPDGPADEITVADAARAWLHYIEHEKDRASSTVRDYATRSTTRSSRTSGRTRRWRRSTRTRSTSTAGCCSPACLAAPRRRRSCSCSGC